MRKLTIVLAILGLSVGGAVAQDLFGPSKQQAPKSGGSVQFINSRPAARAPETRPAAEPQKLPNYYEQLFGGNREVPATPDASTTSTRTRLMPAPVNPSDAVETNGSQVIQAEFQHDPQETLPVIQQVRFGGNAARPFPGIEREPALPGALNMAPQVVNTPASEITIRSETPTLRAEPAAGNVNFRDRAVASLPATSSLPAETAVPATGPQSPCVKVEWERKSALNVGQESQCELVVKNTSETTAHRVVVEAHFPTNVRLLGTSPAPSQSDTFLGWEFAELAPGQEERIKVKLIPLQRGTIATKADVRYSAVATNTFTVSEPLLAVDVQGPGQVMVGESAPHNIVVTNPGTGVATNVKIEAVIPEGLEHVRGKRLLMEIGSLNPGETRNVRLAMAAVAGGTHQIQVQARASGGLVRDAIAQVAVIAPSLTASIDGPGLRFLGRQGTFRIRVSNDGQAATNNVQVMHKVPEGFTFDRADRGVQYDPASRLLTWFVGRLDVNDSADLQVTLTAEQLGQHLHHVRATSEHGSLADAELQTRVEGTSSLAIEVVDLDDPVEVGTEAVYEVRVTNEGSAASRDVGLACELAPGVRLVAAEGPVEHLAKDNIVAFRTIGELGPGKSVVYRVRVQSSRPGSARFRCRVISESVAEPLTVDELTKFYGE